MTQDASVADDLRRIRRSWAMAAASEDVVGRIFYRTLFEIAPHARSLFSGDMDEQSRKLMQTMNWIVDHLDAPELLQPRAESLAVRHLRYGVEADQYALVGQALIDTLQKGLGDDFDAEDAAAWGRVYGTLSKMMTDAAYPGGEPNAVQQPQ